MKKLVIIILAVFLSICTSDAKSLAQLNAEADSAYVAERYEDAVALYSQVADSVQNASVFYNLGCAYYRTDDIAHAILWFERALQLDPGNEDIRFNLEFARGNTIDRITPRHEFFLVSVYRSMVLMMSLNQWAYVSLGCFVVALLFLLLFLYSRQLIWRKVGFFASIVFVLLTLLGNVCAFQQRYFAAHRTGGVVVVPSVSVKSTPAASGNDLFVLHEGTTVELQDASMRDWCEVRIADGKVGWLPKSSIEVI